MKTLLEDAKREIESLRRQNEILRAQVDVMDLFGSLLFTKPPARDQLMAPDVAYALGKAIQDLESVKRAREAAEHTKNQSR